MAWSQVSWFTAFPGKLVVILLPTVRSYTQQWITWSRVNEPSSRLIALAPFLRISLASRILLENVFESLSRILASAHLMMWFSWATWSVIADLCCSVVDAFLFALVNLTSATVVTSFWCSFNRVSNCLPLSPTYMTCHIRHRVHHKQRR